MTRPTSHDGQEAGLMARKEEARQVFVVIGTTGEYSDRSEWLVRAFMGETLAQRFAEDCTRIAEEWMAGDKGYYRDDSGVHALDPNFRCDYAGTRYYVNACPIEAA